MLSTAVNRHCSASCLWAVEQTRLTQCECIYACGHVLYLGLLCRYRICRAPYVDPWDWGFTLMHTLWHTNTRCGFLPVPGGSHSVAGHSYPWLWAESQQVGLKQGDTQRARGEIWEEDLLRRKEKRWIWRGKGKGKRWRGGLRGLHITYFIIYKSVPVILETEVGLRAEE